MILTILILGACKKDKGIVFSEFPNEFALEGEIIENRIHMKMGTVDIFDSLLIICSPLDIKECIHLFNKNSFVHLKSVGTRGRGPGEISVPGHGCIDKNEGILWYRDIGKKILWEFDIRETLKDNAFKPKNSLNLPDDKFFIQFYNEGNGYFSFSNPSQDTLISFFDYNANYIDPMSVINKLKVYGKLGKETCMFNATYIYDKHPSERIYVIAYRMADNIAIVDSKSEIISIANGPGKVLERPVFGEKNYIETNQMIAVDEEFIYCLYSGEKNSVEKNGEIVHNFARKVHVYNWKLEPIALLNLGYSVADMEIDKECNRLVTFSPETGGLVYYNLPTF